VQPGKTLECICHPVSSRTLDRAEELDDDPLQLMLVSVKLLAEMMGELEGLHPGCLVASFTYDS